MENSKGASTDTHSASSTNIVLLFLVVGAAIVLFGIVAYVYTHDEDASLTMPQEKSEMMQQDEQGDVQGDRTIVREDGEIVHVGTCPFKDGCGDETQIVKEKKYRAKVQSVDDDVIVFLTDDNVEMKARVADVSVEKVDLETKESVAADATALAVEDAVVINLNTDTDAIENIYILSGVFR